MYSLSKETDICAFHPARRPDAIQMNKFVTQLDRYAVCFLVFLFQSLHRDCSSVVQVHPQCFHIWCACLAQVR